MFYIIKNYKNFYMNKLIHKVPLTQFFFRIVINKFSFPPYIVLVLTILKILYPESITIQSPYALLVLCLPITIITEQSYYYLIGPLLNSDNIPLTILNMCVGLATINEKWKLFFFVLSILQYLSSYYNENFLYGVGAVLVFIASQSYQNFMFQRKYNEISFITSSISAMLLITLLTLKMIHWETFKNYLVVLVVILFSKLFQLVYKNRVKKMLTLKTDQIKSPEQAYAYIQQYQNRLQKQRYRFSIISHHKFDCLDPECLCRNSHQKTNKRLDNFLIELLYRDFLINWKNKKYQYLYHKFISLKIAEGKLVQAICMCEHLKYSQPDNIFMFIIRLRTQQALKNRQQELDQTLNWSNLYIEGLQYDRYVSQMIQRIQVIVHTKIQFLKQLAKQCSKLVSIEQKGHKIIDSFQKLHDFFQQKILKYQEKLNCCTATIIYCSYLISITNSTQYPRMLIKKTKQNFYESQSNTQFKFEIQTILIENVVKIANSPKVSNQSQQIQPTLKNAMIIKAVSQSFCKLAQVSKNLLIGSQIQNLIPPIYRKDHDKLVQSVFRGVYDQNSKVLSNRRLYPVYFGQNQTALITINLKFIIQSNSKLGFVCLVEPIPRKHKLILTNFNLQNLSAQPYCDCRVLESDQLSKKIQENKKNWIENSVFQTSEILLEFHDQRFSVKISSPSQHRFLENKQQLPIHLEIKNEIENDPTKAQNYIKIVNDLEVRKYLDKIQNELAPILSSQETNGTKKLSLNYLSKINKLNTFSYFKFVYFALALQVITAIAISAIHCNVLRLNKISNDDNNSLIASLEILQKIKISFTEVLSISFDLYATNFDQISQQQQKFNYEEIYLMNFSNQILENKYKVLNQLISDKLPKFSGKAEGIFQSMIFDKFEISTNLSKLNETFYGLLKNCLVDVAILSQTDCQKFKSTTIRKYFLNFLMPKLETYINNIHQLIEKQFHQHLYGNIAMSVSFSIVLVFLMIPVRMFFGRYAEYRVSLYDTILTVEGKYIKSQIQLLLKFQNFVKERTKSSQFQYKSRKNLFKSNHFSQLELSSSFIKNSLSFQNQVKYEKQKTHIRKKMGQLNLNQSLLQSWKSAPIKCLMITIILIIVCSVLMIGVIKVIMCYQSINLQQSQYSYQKLNYQRQQSLLNLKDLFSKIKFQKASFETIDEHYKSTKTNLEELEKILNDYHLDETIIPCNKKFDGFKICQNQHSQSSLSFLLLTAEKLILNLYQTNKINSGVNGLLDFCSTILIYLKQITQKQSNLKLQGEQDFIKNENNWMIVCQNILYFQCLLLVLVSYCLISSTIRQYQKQVKFFLLFSIDAIQNNKRIQCFIEKISKY